MAAVPGAPQMKIRELEEENMHLSRQVKQLHRQLLETRSALRPDIDQRSATPPTFDDGMVECDSDVVKLRRTVEESDDLYMSISVPGRPDYYGLRADTSGLWGYLLRSLVPVSDAREPVIKHNVQSNDFIFGECLFCLRPSRCTCAQLAALYVLTFGS
ncbi:hypothetical protein PHLCEN_2v11847 [Hermanssonia centrifuga]|uniref:Uncharacterized protein n=1 Tax=Hermanssonia centrifuga TaxID=98765 RepID=A0A2R6NIP6_9APHY|nr:hypothetical protein PHLCEN_2v11847 [Hermanssonia centrifuga]